MAFDVPYPLKNVSKYAKKCAHMGASQKGCRQTSQKNRGHSGHYLVKRIHLISILTMLVKPNAFQIFHLQMIRNVVEEAENNFKKNWILYFWPNALSHLLSQQHGLSVLNIASLGKTMALWGFRYLQEMPKDSKIISRGNSLKICQICTLFSCHGITLHFPYCQSQCCSCMKQHSIFQYLLLIL